MLALKGCDDSIVCADCRIAGPNIAQNVQDNHLKNVSR